MDILNAPGMWGKTLEALELQVLLLLEVQAQAECPRILEKNPRAVLDAYAQELHRVFPEAGNLPLHDIVTRENFTVSLQGLMTAVQQEVLVIQRRRLEGI